MISLHSDALVFATARGELIPCSAESVVVELMGDSASSVDPQVVHEAATAVLHHFKEDQSKSCVTVGEFAQALARILRNFGLQVREAPSEDNPVPGPGTDLRVLAADLGGAAELFFFSRLRLALRDQLSDSPSTVRFSGLRSCVKRLAGARRWSPRCQRLQDQIVEYLRRCFTHEIRSEDCLLVVR